MAAQGNPKLYARQKAKYLTLSLLALLLLSVYVQAEVVLYCQTELATGIIKDKQTGQWGITRFNTERYTIKFNDDYTFVTGLLRDRMWPCAPYDPDPLFQDNIVCSKPGGSAFLYDLQTRRFLYSSVSPWSYQHPNGTDTSELYAGTCQKF